MIVAMTMTIAMVMTTAIPIPLHITETMNETTTRYDLYMRSHARNSYVTWG